MNATTRAWRIEVGGESTGALFEPATSAPHAVLVFAHGAGGHMGDSRMNALARVLRAQGFDIVRFNFLYSARASRRPDAMPLLKACMLAVIAQVRRETGSRRLIIGGRSMGGRVASMLAADGVACDGLMLFAYPLHPAGKPEKLRDAHLPRIGVPVLAFNGTRDALCGRDLMQDVLRDVRTPWRMHWLEGADHSFHVLKSSGRSDADVLAEIGEVSAGWLTETFNAADPSKE